MKFLIVFATLLAVAFAGYLGAPATRTTIAGPDGSAIISDNFHGFNGYNHHAFRSFGGLPFARAYNYGGLGYLNHGHGLFY